MADGTIVTSLSWLSTHLVGSLFKNKHTLGQIVVDIIIAAAIACLFALTNRPKKIFDINPESIRGLVIGIIALLLWYLITIIDLFLHEARTAVPYNYFLIGVPIAALKFPAEGFLTVATYRTVLLHLLQQTRTAKLTLIFGEVLNLALIVIALYSVGSLVARQVVWLQLADEKTRGGFAWPQRRFEAAFYCVQFCLALLATVFAAVNAWTVHHATGEILSTTHRLFWGSLSLWIWCTSEMGFVVKYHFGDRLPARDTGLARDTIFGLFMLAFFILLAVDTTNGKVAGTSNRTRLPTHLSPLLSKMKSACRAHVVSQLQNRTKDNERPPPFTELIRDLRRTPTAPFHRSLRDERAKLEPQALRTVDEKYKGYVTELEGRYGQLESTNVAREQ